MFYDLTIEQKIRRSVWTCIPGNSIEYAYYSGVEAGNPSGNKNLKTATYKKGTDTVFTVTYTWDSSDDILTETCN